MHTKLCCCAARAYSKQLLMLCYSKVNWRTILAQLVVAIVSETGEAGMQQGQAHMHTKLCCCTARAYSKPLLMLCYSKVNWRTIVTQLDVAIVSETGRLSRCAAGTSSHAH